MKVIYHIHKLLDVMLHKFHLYPVIGIELEFYLKGSSCTLNTSSAASVLSLLDKNNINCTIEKGLWQYEAVVPHTSCITTLCTEFAFIKANIIKAAHSVGLEATFAAKPFSHDYGSAAHYHLSLHSIIDGTNAFSYGAVDGNVTLSHSIAGMLRYLNCGMYMLVHQDNTANSRYVPYKMAPVNLSWGGNNRTTAIRIPDSAEQNRRIEFRVPPASSIIEDVILFLIGSVMLGLEQAQEPQPRIYGNAYDLQYQIPPLYVDAVSVKRDFNFYHIINNYLAQHIALR